jgi:hypothetical protein
MTEEQEQEATMILWLAALDRVPIGERIEWVAKMLARYARVKKHREEDNA